MKLLNYPLLVKTPSSLVLDETGLGSKLTEKQNQICRVIKDWDLPDALKKIGIKRQDINYVILTHGVIQALQEIHRFGDTDNAN